MTELKHGDRVLVTFEGKAQDSRYNDNVWTTVIRDGASMSSRVKVEDCTVLTPPVKVGDALDQDQIRALPISSVIGDAEENHYFVTRTGICWAGDYNRIYSTIANATLLYLPDAA